MAGAGIGLSITSATAIATVSAVRAANAAVDRPANSMWNLPAVNRGRVAEDIPYGRPAAIKGVTSWNFPTIDDLCLDENDPFYRVASSVKSIDLTAERYQNVSTLIRTLDDYADQLNNFTNRSWTSNGQLIEVTTADYDRRQLNIVMEPRAATQQQANAINQWLRTFSSRFTNNMTVSIQDVEANLPEAAAGGAAGEE